MNVKVDEYFETVCPGFQNGIVKVYYTTKVIRIGQRNTVKKREIVIASNGVYLAKTNAFGIAKVSKKMSYYDMESININGTLCSISSKNQQIRIRSKKIIKIAYLVAYIRTKQFPAHMLPISINITENDEKYKNVGEKKYRTQFILADRITSCAMHFGVELKLDEIREYFRYPALKYSTFTVTNQMIQLDIFYILELALSFESDLKTLIFSNLILNDALPLCQHIIKYNSNITNLVIEQCDLTDSASVLESFTKNVKLSISGIKFRICDATNDHFIKLFELLSIKCKNIQSLSFDHSILENSSIASVFQSIFFNESFHNLENLEFDSIGDVPDLETHVGSLAGCSWALTSKCVRKLSVNGCDFDISSLLQRILCFDIGLRELHLCENKFRKKIPQGIQPCVAGFLDMSRCSIGIQAISSFIESVVSGTIDARGIDLSSLRMTPPEFLQMLALLSADVVVMPSLECFYFDNNIVDTEEAKLLASFIRHQPKLRRVSLNCCINVRDSSTGIQCILDALLSLNNLESLSLRGDFSNKDFSAGRMLTSFLTKAAAKKTVKFLDLTNQFITDDGLEAIFGIDPLEELWFDRCQSSSYPSLVSYLKRLMNSNLKLCGWPAKEIEHLKTIKTADKNFVEGDDLVLHFQFSERFSFLCDEDEETRRKIMSQRFVLNEPTYEEMINAQPKETNAYITDSCWKIEFSENIKKLADENGIELVSEPFAKLISEAEQSLSLSSLLQKFNCL